MNININIVSSLGYYGSQYFFSDTLKVLAEQIKIFLEGQNH